jgi:elongation factor G
MMAEKVVSMNPPASTEAIRNVVLVGPAGSGKTTLFESLLVAAGALVRAGSTADGTTVSDYDESEKKQQRSVGLSVAAFDYDGVRINLIDTPGYADFAGEVGAGLRAADAALFVVTAKSGFDGNTRLLWSACAEVDMPRAIVVTKTDAPDTSAVERIAELRAELGSGVLAFELPLGEDIIDLLSQTVHHHAEGKHTARAASESDTSSIEDARNALIEAIVSEADDDVLMESYLGGEDIDTAALRADVVQAVAHGRFFPALFTRTTPVGYGADEVLALIAAGFPSPVLHSIPAVTALGGGVAQEITASADGNLVAEVVHTSSDNYLGRISLVRVFSGTFIADDIVHVSGHFSSAAGREDHDVDEKVGALYSPFGKTLRPTTKAIAGDIVAVARLSTAETGDTLSSKAEPVLMPAWSMPEPLHPMAVVAHAKADEDKLAQSLHRLLAEDPCIRLERNSETKQTVLWTLGDSHLEVVLDRLKNRFGVNVDSVPFKVQLRETFAKAASGHGQLVKQSGGHGQYGVCDITVEPLPNGSGFEFVDEVVGGAVPRQYIPSVEHGVKMQMERGLAAGYHVVDIRVRLQDGKSHSVDSSDMSFQQAGQLALQDAAKKAGVTLLEPISTITVEVDDEYVGAILSDISSRRGRVTGTQPAAAQGRSQVIGDVPDLELVTYSTSLRSLSHGTGRFSREVKGYETMPANIAKAFLEQ